MLNALTIDVEDYFQVTAFEKFVKMDDWESYPLRVTDSTLRILDMLDDFSMKATFFVLGWVAERRPEVVREILRRGHEIACHGYGHKLIYHIGPERFRDDVRKAKGILEDICGERIVGFRAPSYSITKETPWAFDVLIGEGFEYDSSIFPIMHDIYGVPDANRFPHEIRTPNGIIKEFPISTLEIRTFNIRYRMPFSGGGYLRLLPLWIIKKAIRFLNESEKIPSVLYFHPWEIDPGQPRIKACLRWRFRHYLNLEKTERKLKGILSSFSFSPMSAVLECLEQGLREKGYPSQELS